MYFFLSNKTIRLKHLGKSMGPVLLSAFSIFITFCLLQPLALFLDPTFSLLASRGTGKIAITVIALLHILLLATTCSKKFFDIFLETNLYFITRHAWISTFLGYFALFFLLHWGVIGVFYSAGYMQLDLAAFNVIPKKALSLLFGFVVTFFLAWTEEAIFRGTLYPFLIQKISKLSGIILASAIFMLAHDLTNPLNLITVHWRLGLGLFLLGVFLNLLFELTGKLYVGMGAHAGLVYVKVFLRRIPLLTFLPAEQLTWWLSNDLRETIAIHVLFAFIITVIIIRNYSRLTSRTN